VLGVALGAVGYAAARGLAEYIYDLHYALETTPGSLLSPGLSMGLGQRGGLGALVRSPADAARENQALFSSATQAARLVEQGMGEREAVMAAARRFGLSPSDVYRALRQRR
jgi:hypothetical protein